MLFFLATLAHANCDLPSLRTAIDEAETAFAEMEADDFEEAVSYAETTMACMAEPLTPVDAAGYHRLQALSAFFSGDPSATQLHFQAVQGTQPGYELPVSIAPAEHPLRKDFEAAKQFATGDTFALDEPYDGWLLLDGRRTVDAPSGRPFIFQRLDAIGAVGQTAYLPVGSPVPGYRVKATAAPAPTAIPAASGGGKGPLKIVGLGLGVAAAGLYGTAFASRGSYNQAVETGNQAKIDSAKGTTNALTLASIGALGAGAVFTVTGFLGGGS